MMNTGIFTGIKNLSPNANIKAEGNVLEILIPKIDLINQLKNSVPDNIKPFVDVEYTSEGLLMKVRML